MCHHLYDPCHSEGQSAKHRSQRDTRRIPPTADKLPVGQLVCVMATSVLWQNVTQMRLKKKISYLHYKRGGWGQCVEKNVNLFRNEANRNLVEALSTLTQ